MGTKVRVDQMPTDDFDDWEPAAATSDKTHRTRQSNKRREIEEILEQRRLKYEMHEVYDEYLNV
ncbi:PA3496 family putative envelope integrity protein [Pontibacter sp. JAM-7]|uniref:PA3496 family putative envelope integrity protein n=1 Tax=Pontibacter sp. JAM-7 TaxID=3366581 RepID=UPI003AF7ED25